ncbi:MAG: hypothetical protein JWQ87_4786 [Candidatus Sulfotelmatobacter sp.]|nr:hypothetical protein [Candidatus Sulfotelmatobacter sp.]
MLYCPVTVTASEGINCTVVSAVKIRVPCWPEVNGLGLNEAVTPEGRPTTVNCTGVGKPPLTTDETMMGTELPPSIVVEPGLRDVLTPLLLPAPNCEEATQLFCRLDQSLATVKELPPTVRVA